MLFSELSANSVYFFKHIKSTPKTTPQSCIQLLDYSMWQKTKSLVNELFTRLCCIFRCLSAVRRGLEPLTPCVTGTYSNQLN